MTRRGYLEFRKVVKNRGYFGGLRIEIQELNSSKRVSELIINHKVESEWISPLYFGAELFFEKFWSKNNLNLQVVILEWNWLPEDTTIPVASYLMFEALCQAYEIEQDIFIYDEVNNIFNLKL